MPGSPRGKSARQYFLGLLGRWKPGSSILELLVSGIEYYVSYGIPYHSVTHKISLFVLHFMPYRRGTLPPN